MPGCTSRRHSKSPVFSPFTLGVVAMLPHPTSNEIYLFTLWFNISSLQSTDQGIYIQAV